jgi:precorrin-6A/cobalt-precorrin-6A reductase
VTAGDLLVIGGTSDARHICQLLDNASVAYTLSVATDTGAQLAGNLAGELQVGRLDAAQLEQWLRRHHTRWVIDASHPYADVVSDNLVQACQRCGVTLSRYQRPAQIDELESPLLYKVDSLEAACQIARRFGPRVLLTTGSKALAAWQQGLPGKTLLARVLPTAKVLAECEALGLGVDNLFALRGPFSEAFNQAFYQLCQPDVMITKESGAQGGYLEKVRPCLALAIPCIVLTRPAVSVTGDELLQNFDQVAARLARWLSSE